MVHSKSSSKKEVYNNKSLPQETRKITNKQPNLTPRGTRKRRTNKPKVSKGKEIIKIRTEKKISETKSWFFEKVNKLINLEPNSSRKKGGPNK